jgi:hypothetical protein
MSTLTNIAPNNLRLSVNLVQTTIETRSLSDRVSLTSLPLVGAMTVLLNMIAAPGAPSTGTQLVFLGLLAIILGVFQKKAVPFLALLTVAISALGVGVLSVLLQAVGG